MLTEKYAAQIGRVYPELLIKSIELIKGGQYNDVLVVNRDLLFRFPKVAPAVATIAREVAILRQIQRYLPLPVPQPTYVNLEGQAVGSAFMGYRLLPGQPLWRADVEAIRKELVLERMARQLAEFLLALHTVSVAEVIPAAVPLADDPAMWAELFQRIEARLFVHMRSEARQQVRAHFGAFLDNPALSTFEPVLRHGDFGGGNIVWDPALGTITGVVDFGAVALGDAATDLASLGAGFGDAFLARCSRYYPITAEMRARMAFYRGTFALQEALFGVENDDQAAFAAGMAEYV